MDGDLYREVPISMLAADLAQPSQWGRDQLSRLGIDVLGDAGPARTRPWSYVVPWRTTAGTVWLKAGARGFAHEAALLQLIGSLATVGEGDIAVPLAVRADRGWLLTRDGGPTLRARGGADLAGWLSLLSSYASLQRRLVPATQDAVALGTPDLRGRAAVAVLEPAVAAASDPGVHGPHRLDADEARSLLRLVPQLHRLADELADSPVASTVEHNDPHPNNVFAASGALFDWGDAVVAHPFLGPANALPDAAADLAVPVRSATIDGLREGYLDGFADLAPRTRLHRDAELAAVLAQLARARSWLQVPPEGRRDWPAALPQRLRSLATACTPPGLRGSGR